MHHHAALAAFLLLDFAPLLLARRPRHEAECAPEVDAGLGQAASRNPAV